MRGWMLAIAAVSMMAGCAAESVWAPDEAVSRAAYRHDGPPRLTLFTMLNNHSDAGAHVRGVICCTAADVAGMPLLAEHFH